MKVTIVHENDFAIDAMLEEVILAKESDHVPGVGDVVKVGHTLNDYQAFRVNQRVFRAKAGAAETPDAFQEVILVVGGL